MTSVSQTSPHNPASRLLHVLGRPECKIAKAPLTPAGWVSAINTKPDVIEFVSNLRATVEEIESLWNKLPESKQRLTSGVVTSLKQALDHTLGIAQVSGRGDQIGSYITPPIIFQLEIIEAEISEKFELPTYSQEDINELRSDIEKCLQMAKDSLIPQDLRDAVTAGLRDILRQMDSIWFVGPARVKSAGDKALGRAVVIYMKDVASGEADPDSKSRSTELMSKLAKMVAGADKIAGFSVKLIRIGDFLQKMLPGY